MKTKRQFTVPGIYHDIIVRVVTQKYIGKLAKDKNVIAFYDGYNERIYVSRDFDSQVNLHIFYHELSHYIIDTLSDVGDVETRCDLLAAYLMRLGPEQSKIENNLLEKPDKK